MAAVLLQRLQYWCIFNLPQSRNYPLIAFACVFPGGASKGEESVEGQYVRYVSPDGDWAESRVEYDMDDEDEEWLAQYNSQVSKRAICLLGPYAAPRVHNM